MYLYTLQLTLLFPLASSLAPNSWQKRIDRALLDVDGARNPQDRIRLLQRAFKDPEFPQDVSRGVEAIRKDGFGKGHPTFIEAVWPKGTIARSDIEGIRTLVKTIPERVDELQNSEMSLLNVIQSTSQNLSSEKIKSAVQEGLATSERRKQSIKLIQNVFRRDQKYIETISYSSMDTIEGKNGTNVEICEFDSFNKVVCELPSSEEYTLVNMGSGLAKLTNYVLGENSEKVSGAMTVPFIMQNSAMWIKRPENMINATPNDDGVNIKQSDLQRIAVLEFSGICTIKEIERQKAKLLKVLTTKDQNKWDIVDDSILVLQYNAPGTLPWRRKNQVGFLVEERKTGMVPKEITRDDSDTVADISLPLTTESSFETNATEDEHSIVIDENETE